MPFEPLPCLIPVDESGPRTIWLVRDPFMFRSVWMNKLYEFPEKFYTDLASVPRAPFLWLSFGGRAAAASAAHDFLYDRGKQLKMIEDRWEADYVYLEMMLDTGVEEKLAHQAYFFVRDYGGNTFNET